MRSLRQSLIHWGVWPAIVMVAAQQEAARLSGQLVAWPIMAMTLAGTLSVYGADRWLERRSLDRLAPRHAYDSLSHWVFVIVIMTLITVSLPELDRGDWLWIGGLGVLGLGYLLITSQRVPSVPLVKESLGCACFVTVVWGTLVQPPLLAPLGCIFLGYANFFWSGHQDRERDQANRSPTLAVVAPEINILVGRVCAVVAAVLVSVDTLSLFLPCALILFVWPRHQKSSVDLCFLPLLLIVLMV